MTDLPAPERDDDELDNVGEAEAGLNVEVLRRRREWVLTGIALLLVVGVSLFVASRFFRSPPPPLPSDLAVLARRAVKDFFPGMALEFGSREELTIRPLGESVYEVKGRVFVINPAGRARDFVFTCTLERSEREWRAAKLQVTQLF